MECRHSSSPKTLETVTDENSDPDTIQLCENIFIFSGRTIGSHDNVFEGEVRSSVYGVRPCVIKFAAISEQNIREAEILSKLESHTNVIAVIQSGTYPDAFGDRVFIALDKCHNENLRQYLTNRKAAGISYDLNQAIDFAKQLIAGVMYIHDNNVIHLDLKPSNILLSQNLHLIKIADFGLSIVVKGCKSKVCHKCQFGTNGYRPIESFGNGMVSRRTDIFSLGTVLFHLLSNGDEVFGCDEHRFIRNVMNDIRHTSGLLVSNPITTEHLIKFMVSRDRCRRPTIREVLDHPCWSRQETQCNFEYFADDEIEDTATNLKDCKEVAPQTEPCRDKEFLERMKKMGFNRKPVIAIFDSKSKNLCCYDYRKKEALATRIQKYPGDPYRFSAVSLGEYIYLFRHDRSLYRLEYCDVTATWKRLNNWTGDHEGFRPPIAASSKTIYLVGSNKGYDGPRATNSVSKYDASGDLWEELCNKPTATWGSAICCSKDYLYSFGGFDEHDKPANILERMDLTLSTWTRIGSMTNGQYAKFAAEFRGNIHVFHDRGGIGMQMFNPKSNQWTKMKSWKIPNVEIHNVFATDGKLLVLSIYSIYELDVENAKYSVEEFNHFYCRGAVLVKMST